MFTREILSQDETRPGLKSSLSMVKCLLLLTRFFRTHPCQKDMDEIHPRIKKKKKRCVNTSSRDEILK